ncbi:Uncharacterised protein [Vibrio cholerae]|nr:Uncharacterised protein [Vibrio cholerae]
MNIELNAFQVLLRDRGFRDIIDEIFTESFHRFLLRQVLALISTFTQCHGG